MPPDPAILLVSNRLTQSKPRGMFRKNQELKKRTMHQIEVKRWLVEHLFRPSDGWSVVVDVDGMEKGKGGQHSQGKGEIATEQITWMKVHGVTVGSHPVYGRTDIVAEHVVHGVYLLEVEGDTSKQKEQAMYSALGQAILMMDQENSTATFGLAVPDDAAWETHISKIPSRICDLLGLKLWLVSKKGVREHRRGEQ
ncbi:MAG: hypothetical protein AO396_07055 [Candidatus Fermentibacter daniensis]|nr:MAG: hypothetical protein AO396_07055 [Candidatus Fermentibacter daniensis]